MDENATDTITRPTAEALLPEIHSRLARLGPPTLARLWEGLRVRFAGAWAAYCTARGTDEAPEWEEFPLSAAWDLVPLLDMLGLPYEDGTAKPRTAESGEPMGDDAKPAMAPARKAKQGATRARSSPRGKQAEDGAMGSRRPVKPIKTDLLPTALPLPFPDLPTAPAAVGVVALEQAPASGGLSRGRRVKKDATATVAEAQQLRLFDEG